MTQKTKIAADLNIRGLTPEQKIKMDKYQNSLSYGRGIPSKQWDELIEFRKINLTSRGLNPDDFDLRQRSVSKKFGR